MAVNLSARAEQLRRPRAPRSVRPISTAPPATEDQVQRSVVDLLAYSSQPDVAWTHMPSGGQRSPGAGGKLKALGHAPGWPDLVFVKEGRFYGLELKTVSGRVSPVQHLAHDALIRAGASIHVAYGFDDAVLVLRAWGMIR